MKINLIQKILVLVLLLSATKFLKAQQSFSIKLTDTVRFIPSGKSHDYHLILKNLTDKEISVTAVMEDTKFPSADWSWSICMGELCFPPGSNPSAPAVIPAKGESEVKVGIVADDFAGVACFKLKFSNANEIKQFDLCSIGNVNEIIFVEKLFPNPVSNKFNITLPNNINAKSDLIIYNSDGYLVSSLQTNIENGKTEIDVSSLSNGSYQYEMIIGTKKISGSFIVIK